MKIASTLSPFYSVGMFRAYAILTLTHFLATVIPGSAAHPAWQQEVKSTTTALNRVENGYTFVKISNKLVPPAIFPLKMLNKFVPPIFPRVYKIIRTRTAKKRVSFQRTFRLPHRKFFDCSRPLDIEENWSNHEALNKEDALRINFEFLTSDEFIPKEGYRELELLLKSIKRRNYVHKLKTVPKIKEFRFLNEEDMEDVERDVEQLGKILLKTLDRKKNHKLVYIESRSLSSKICELLDFFELNLHPGIIKKISKKSGMPQGFEEQHKLMLMFTRMTFNQEMQRSFDEFTLNYPGTYLFHGLDIKSIYEYYNNTLKNLLKSFTNLHQSVLSNRNDDALSHWLNEQMDLRILANTPQVDHQKWEDNWEKVKSETEKIKYWP
ncbi:hypothetical protein H4Q26_006958 [Puccinia striiformis f. sp. tritici PST-130]|nr:hypothetical protein H4Q26_006958 [Puccinia striiformis f. sp. tritici PST-130]